jgi:hypothetical protein
MFPTISPSNGSMIKTGVMIYILLIIILF